MNRWLYRAAGTVGIAGGFLALGAGSAQADQTEISGAALADVFSPTSGLPPLELTGPDAGAPGAPGALGAPTGPTGPAGGGLRLDPADGRTAATAPPELLPGLPGLPTDAPPELPSGGLPGGLPGTSTGGLPALPTGGLSSLLGGGSAGGSDPAIGVGLPTDQLADLRGRPVGLPTDAATGPLTALDRPMPFLTGPLTASLLGGRSLGDLVMIGDLAGQVPVAGPMVSQTAGNLPLVGDVVPSTPGLHPPGARTLPADLSDPGLPVPPDRDQLPPVIADQLATEGGYAPELFASGPGSAEITDAVPLIGPALDPIGKMVGVGNLAKQLPVVGPLAGSALGNLPVVADPGAAARPNPAARLDPAASSGPAARPDPAGMAGERPIAGEDPEFSESAELPPAAPASAELAPAAPASAGLAPAGAASAEFLPVDPLGGLTGQLPVPLPLDMLRSLPVIGELGGGLPA